MLETKKLIERVSKKELNYLALFFTFYLLFTSISFAQIPSKRWEFGVVGDKTLTDNSYLSVGLFAREIFNKYDVEKIEPYLDRTNIAIAYGRHFNKFDLEFAYLYRSNFPFEGGHYNENRLSQRIKFKTGFILPLAHRFGIDERFFKEKTDLRLRYRLQHKGAYKGDKIVEKSFYYVISDEMLVTFSDVTKGENRVTFGSGYVFGNGSAIDLALAYKYTDFLDRKKSRVLQLISTYFIEF